MIDWYRRLLNHLCAARDALSLVVTLTI